MTFLIEFAESFTHYSSEELVGMSDAVQRIRNTCDEALPAQEVTFILDLFHALQYADTAVKAVTPRESKQTD